MIKGMIRDLIRTDSGNIRTDSGNIRADSS